MATVVKTDRQWVSEGPYMAFASPWSSYIDTTLLESRDFINTISFQKGDLAKAKDIQLTWRWPEPDKRSPKCGVFAYNHVAMGNYDGGNVMTPWAPRQAGSTADLVVGYQVDTGADYRKYNGLGEFYLTSKPGDADSKMVEIGWFWNAPPETAAWTKTGRQLGAFTDRYGKKWDVAVMSSGVAGKFVTFVPTTGQLSAGNFDAKRALDMLVAAGVVKSEWWLNGIAIGVEPLGGIGTAVVRNFHLTKG